MLSDGQGRGREASLPAPLRIDAVELRLLRLDLVEPFETSFGRVSSRLIVLVRMEAEGLEGWGEIVAGEQPLYSYETVGTALHVVREFFAPAILRAPLRGLAELPGGSTRSAATRWPAPVSSSPSWI